MPSSEGFEPYTDEAGRLAGYCFDTADGQRVACDLQGHISHVYDAEQGDFAGAEEGWAVELPRDLRLDAIEARLGDHYGSEDDGGYVDGLDDPEDDDAFELAAAAFAEELEPQLAEHEAARGIDYTRRETEALFAHGLADDLNAGRSPDTYAAVARTLADDPEALHQTHSRAGRQAVWVEKLQDAELDAQGVPLGESLPVQHEAPDLNNRSQRHVAMVERLEGKRGPLNEPEAQEAG